MRVFPDEPIDLARAQLELEILRNSNEWSLVSGEVDEFLEVLRISGISPTDLGLSDEEIARLRAVELEQMIAYGRDIIRGIETPDGSILTLLHDTGGLLTLLQKTRVTMRDLGLTDMRLAELHRCEQRRHICWTLERLANTGVYCSKRDLDELIQFCEEHELPLEGSGGIVYTVAELRAIHVIRLEGLALERLLWLRGRKNAHSTDPRRDITSLYEYLEEAGLTLQDIGTSEDELTKLRKHSHRRTARRIAIFILSGEKFSSILNTQTHSAAYEQMKRHAQSADCSLGELGIDETAIQKAVHAFHLKEAAEWLGHLRSGKPVHDIPGAVSALRNHLYLAHASLTAVKTSEGELSGFLEAATIERDEED